MQLELGIVAVKFIIMLKKNELLTLYFMWKFRCHDKKSFNALKEDSRKGDFKELKDYKKNQFRNWPRWWINWSNIKDCMGKGFVNVCCLGRVYEKLKKKFQQFICYILFTYFGHTDRIFCNLQFLLYCSIGVTYLCIFLTYTLQNFTKTRWIFAWNCGCVKLIVFFACLLWTEIHTY